MDCLAETVVAHGSDATLEHLREILRNESIEGQLNGGKPKLSCED